MQDHEKNQDQLIDELNEMRRRVAEMETVQRSLNENESRHREIIARSSEAIFIIQDGWIKYANDKTSEIVGYSTEEILASAAIAAFVHPDDREMVAQYHASRLQGDETHYRYAFRIVRKDENVRWVEMSSSLIMWEGRPAALCLMADITERKQAETTLIERERHFRSLLETIGDALVVYDNRGRVTFVNKTFELLYGWSHEELSGKPIDNFVPPYEEQITKQSWERTLRGENVVFETRRRTKEGKILDLQLSTAILRDTKGAHTASIVIHRDMTSKKMAEEELHNSEQKYRQIFDHSPLGIFHFDYEGTITACNDKFVQIIGSSREKLVGLNMINDLKDVQIVTAVRRALSGEIGHYDGEYASVTAAKVTAVKVDFSPLLNELGPVLGGIGIAEDITERKQAEDSIARQSAINQSMAELSVRVLAADSIDEIADMILAEALMLTGSEFGYVGYIDQTTGYLICPTMTRGIWEHCEVVGKNVVFQEFGGLWGWSLDHKEALFSNDPTNDPRSGGTPPGHIPIHRVICVPAMDGSRLVGQISVANSGSDYTEEGMTAIQRLSSIFSLGILGKQADDALRDSRELMQVVIDSLPVAILYVDSAERIVFANQTFMSWWGRRNANISGRTVKDILGDYYLRIESRLKPVLAGKKVTYEETVDYKDGIRRNVAASYVPHVGTNGEVKGFACLIADLSDRIKAEQEKHDLQAQLFQSQKVEALGTLVGGIAHDFNNMLQIILGFSQVLLDDKKKGESGYKELQIIIETGKGGADLVNKLLAFGQQGQVFPVPLDLNHQIIQLTTLISHTLPQVVQIDLDLADRPTTIRADHGQIDQLVMNLAINASEAMPNGGRLKIATKTVSLDQEYCKTHYGATPGKYVTLSVKDTGRGMDKATLARIFDPFFSTKERGSTRGTGLGLSVVKGIVQQQGGHVTCESQTGKGTEFKVYFPAIEASPFTAKTIVPTVQSERAETILVVEDNIPVAEFEQRVLENASYTVIVATNGQQALDIYQTRKEEISLVILDLLMPEMSGRDCLMELVKVDPSVKVVIASGYSPEDELHKEISPLVKGFLHKPFAITQLLDSVGSVLRDEL